MDYNNYFYIAVNKLNKNVKDCKISIKSIELLNQDSYKVRIIDEEMQARMDKASPSFHFIDYIPDFSLSMSSTYFLGKSLTSLDASLKITDDMKESSKIILRIAFRIGVKWQDGREEVFKKHEELK